MAAPSQSKVKWYTTARGEKPGRRIIVLDGVVKKKDRIPGDVLERMRGYQRDVESRPGR